MRVVRVAEGGAGGVGASGRRTKKWRRRRNALVGSGLVKKSARLSWPSRQMTLNWPCLTLSRIQCRRMSTDLERRDLTTSLARPTAQVLSTGMSVAGWGYPRS